MQDNFSSCIRENKSIFFTIVFGMAPSVMYEQIYSQSINNICQGASEYVTQQTKKMNRKITETKLPESTLAGWFFLPIGRFSRLSRLIRKDPEGLIRSLPGIRQKKGIHFLHVHLLSLGKYYRANNCKYLNQGIILNSVRRKGTQKLLEGASSHW